MQTSGRLFAALAGKLSQRHQVHLFFRDMPRGGLRKIIYLVQPNFPLLRAFLASDTLVIHTMAALSLAYLMLARLMGKRCVVFLWDDYAYAGGLLAGLERAALALCDKVLIPSEDYRDRAPANAAIFPLWPSRKAGSVAPESRSSRKKIKIVFAGQINQLRGLDKVLDKFQAMPGLPVRLHVFSLDRLPDTVRDASPRAIVAHGFVAPDILDGLLPNFDFGLVSLDPDMRAPAFPSKILAYISSGLPVLYHGPELPALTGLLEGRGLGVVLRAQDGATLAADLARIRTGFASARAAYLRHCALNWGRLAAVL